jgi:hypothetical protein
MKAKCFFCHCKIHKVEGFSAGPQKGANMQATLAAIFCENCGHLLLKEGIIISWSP